MHLEKVSSESWLSPSNMGKSQCAQIAGFSGFATELQLINDLNEQPKVHFILHVHWTDKHKCHKTRGS